MSSPFAERIARGMAYLDDVAPDWEWRINLAVFHLNNCLVCVLGQLFGDFFDHLNASHLPDRWASHHGFALGFREGTPNAYDALTEEWRAAILARREAGKAARPALLAEPAVCFEMGEPRS